MNIVRRQTLENLTRDLFEALVCHSPEELEIRRAFDALRERMDEYIPRFIVKEGEVGPEGEEIRLICEEGWIIVDRGLEGTEIRVEKIWEKPSSIRVTEAERQALANVLSREWK